MDTNLNQRQRLFIHYYAQGMGGRQSAIKAGYKAKNASVVASQNLRKLNIRRALDTLNDRAGVTPSRLVSNLSSVLTQIKKVEFGAGDYVKIMEFMLKLNGIYLKPPPTSRRPSRKKLNTSNGSAAFVNDFFNDKPMSKPVAIVESLSVADGKPTNMIQEQVVEVSRATPNIIRKAVPTPAPLRLATPAYSGKGFSKQEVVSFGNKISYPA